MKRSLLHLGCFIGIVFTSLSCSKMQQEKDLISKYEQNFMGTQIDLGLTIDEIQRIKVIIASDSLLTLKTYLEEKRADIIVEFKSVNISHSVKLEDYKNKLKQRGLSDFQKETYKTRLEMYENFINKTLKAIENFKGDCTNTFLEQTVIKVNAFEANPDSVLAIEYQVKYTIKNPQLNNAKQTLLKKYYFDEMLTKIIKTEQIDIN